LARGFLKERVYSLILLYTHPNLKTLKTTELFSGEKMRINITIELSKEEVIDLILDAVRMLVENPELLKLLASALPRKEHVDY